MGHVLAAQLCLFRRFERVPEARLFLCEKSVMAAP